MDSPTAGKSVTRHAVHGRRPLVDRRSFMAVLAGWSAWTMGAEFGEADTKIEEAVVGGRQRTALRTSDGLLLEAEFAIEGKFLVLRYLVKNSSARDVYLLNRLYRSSPHLVIDPNLIYIHLNGERAALWMHKKIHDIPSDRNVNAPVSPFSTPVRAGGSFSERVNVPLPVREYREYSAGPDPMKGDLRTFHLASFSLGYYSSVPGTEEEVKELAGTQVILPHLPQGTKVQWGVAETSPVHLEVPVIDPSA